MQGIQTKSNKVERTNTKGKLKTYEHTKGDQGKLKQVLGIIKLT